MDATKSAFDVSARYFPTPLQQFQFFDKYARYNKSLGRRETWVETVDRAVSYLRELSEDKLSPDTYEMIRTFILEMKAMPSMRLLAMAGDAARRDNLTIFNCSFMPVDSIDSFVEALSISMAGCGVGFSVERRNVEKLPKVKRQRGEPSFSFVIPDSAEGWAMALRIGLQAWFDGQDVVFDYSQVRPAGIPLLTKGGRASGPEPLRRLLDFARMRILARQGGYLSSLDAHDIVCKVGDAAVSGGVRRTAMISLFDADDDDMLHSKDGEFYIDNPQRWNANNSVVINDDSAMSKEEFDGIFDAMLASERGEPGIFNRAAALRMMPRRRTPVELMGTNPCAEIVLRPHGLCNLSIAVARPDDTRASLLAKVEIATIIGTIQSMATNYPNLRDVWRKNAEEERLLGVDITGQLDCPILDGVLFAELREKAVETNRRYAEILGINPSASVTCVKPSGNSAVLLNSSSGIHPRFSRYYIRRVRVGAATPMLQVLRGVGVPLVPENGQTIANATTWVASFPVKSPDGAITKDDLSAIQQAEWWKVNKLNWTEHNPSVTIYYRPEEIDDLREWVWVNLPILGGMSFLPHSDAKYDNMPYEAISEERYNELAAAFPTIDFSWLEVFEKDDMTEAAQLVACVAGGDC